MRLSVLSHCFFAFVLRNSLAYFAAGDNIVDIRAASRSAPGLEAAKVRAPLCSAAALSHAPPWCSSPDTLALLYYVGEREPSKRIGCCKLLQSRTSMLLDMAYAILTATWIMCSGS